MKNKNYQTVTTLLNQIKTFEVDVDDFNEITDFNFLEECMEKLETDLSHIETCISSVNERISVLEEIKEIENELKELYEIVSDKERFIIKCCDTEEEIQDIENEIENLQEDIQYLEDKLCELT